MSQQWIVGEKQRLQATFTADAASGDPTEPVTVKILKPDGTKEDEENATADTDTVFYYDYTPTMHGTHKARFKSADDAIEIHEFYVYPDVTE